MAQPRHMDEVLSSEEEDVRKKRRIGEDPAWGFVIYRCTYQSDDQWKKFMDLLNTRVREDLEFEGNGYMMEALKWSVQEHRSYEGATKAQIRNLFEEYSAPSDLMTPREEFCLMVDQECLDSALNGPQPPEHDGVGKAFVIIIKRDWAQMYEPDDPRDSVDRPHNIDAKQKVERVVAPGTTEGEKLTEAERGAKGGCYRDEKEEAADERVAKSQERDDRDEDAEDDSDEDDDVRMPLDEGMEPLEGCTMVDVGWMKIGLDFVVPRFWDLVEGWDGWHICYERPPEISCP